MKPSISQRGTDVLKLLLLDSNAREGMHLLPSKVRVSLHAWHRAHARFSYAGCCSGRMATFIYCKLRSQTPKGRSSSSLKDP